MIIKKFKAFDIKNNEMIPMDRLLRLPLGIFVSKNIKNFIFIQCAGFEDKNNKEVYYGDIIKYKYAEETSLSEAIYLKYVISWDDLNHKWYGRQPRDKDGNTIDRIYSGGIAGQQLNKNWKIEVIGNKYQNPELLKRINEK